MINTLKLILSFLFLLLSVEFTYSADFNVSVSNREVEIGKSFKLVVTTSNENSNFQLPMISDFIVISKEKYKRHGKFIYEYEFTPKNVGFFVIPSISDGIDSSMPINIKVYEKEKQIQKNSKSDANSLIKARVDLKVVYVNQIFTYTLDFKTRKDLRANPTYILPMFKDFWKNESTTKSGYELIGGENYFAFEVSTLLYPMRVGTIVIDPSTVSITYIDSNNAKTFETDVVEINVLPLPNLNKPENFSGAVGKYSIFASVNKSKVKVNEPLVLTVNIKGNGNINTISEPKIDLPEDVKKYSTTTKINLDKYMGSKTFKMIIIPLIEGEKILPEISFSYFDPDLKDYVTIKTNKIRLDVYGKQEEDNNVEELNTILEINDEKKGEVINFTINNTTNLSLYDKYFIKSKIILWSIIFFMIIVVLSMIYRIRLIILYKNLSKVTKLEAIKKYNEYFEKANIEKCSKFMFFYYIDLAIRMLLRLKINSNCLFMTKEDIKNNLKLANLDDKLIGRIIDVICKSEKYRFTNIEIGKMDMISIKNEVHLIKKELDRML